MIQLAYPFSQHFGFPFNSYLGSYLYPKNSFMIQAFTIYSSQMFLWFEFPFFYRSTSEWQTICGENTVREILKTANFRNTSHGKRCISDCLRRGKESSKSWQKRSSLHILRSRRVSSVLWKQHCHFLKEEVKIHDTYPPKDYFDLI